jgi:hypothetical protein
LWSEFMNVLLKILCVAGIKVNAFYRSALHCLLYSIPGALND